MINGVRFGMVFAKPKNSNSTKPFNISDFTTTVEELGINRLRDSDDLRFRIQKSRDGRGAAISTANSEEDETLLTWLEDQDTLADSYNFNAFTSSQES